MDIEERAEKWAEEYIRRAYNDSKDTSFKLDLIQAYLAGSEQTQKDYVDHFMNKGDKEWS